MSRREKWFAGIGSALVVVMIGLLVAGSRLRHRIEPYIRQQAEEYLRDRFQADVQITYLRVRLPKLSPLRMLFTHGHGAIAAVEGRGIVMRMRGSPYSPPLFSIEQFDTGIDIGGLFDSPIHVPAVSITGLDITVPPKGQRPDLRNDPSAANADQQAASNPTVIIDRLNVKTATLVMLPADKAKKPLRFHIHDLKLQSAGTAVAMKYDAVLTNATPPGEIHSSGSFGPWRAAEPGDTPLDGDYTFDQADLGVFAGIAGTLSSKGHFGGELDSLTVRGEANVPDFRLKRSGNPVPLRTTFEALVDGTNGNTILKPVNATLGSTRFTTSGAVIKRDTDTHRSISLDVNMPQGRMRDVLRLAMKGEPFLEGTLNLKTRLEIPPLQGKVKDKLRLDGRFDVTEAHFLKSTIQNQLDNLSRRGQGQPRNHEIDSVVSHMRGNFQLANGTIRFQDLNFGVPGAIVQLHGSYDLDADAMDFHGAIKLEAKVSEMVTGWKHWLLKPVDPFLSKNGAGTYLKIKIMGTSKSPSFGLDR